MELAAPEELRLIGVAGRLDPSLNTLGGERDAINVAVPLVERRIAGAGIEVDFRLHCELLLAMKTSYVLPVYRRAALVSLTLNKTGEPRPTD